MSSSRLALASFQVRSPLSVCSAEPIGGSAPKFSLETKFSGLDRKLSDPFSLSCPAQGSPVPSYRFELCYSTEFWHDCSRGSHPTSNSQTVTQCNILLLEPIGGSSPKFSYDSKSSTLFRTMGQAFSLSCPAQGSPVPSYRLVSQILESSPSIQLNSYQLTRTSIFRTNWWIRSQTVCWVQVVHRTKNGPSIWSKLSCTRLTSAIL